MFLDVAIPPNGRKTLPVETRANALAYVFAGQGNFVDASLPVGVRVEKEVAGQELNIRAMTGNRTLVRFGNGDDVTVQAGPDGVRFLLIAGRPLQAPVAWPGPIALNTQAESQQAMRDMQNGSSIKASH